MAKTTDNNIMAQMYDFETVREYYKIISGFFFTSNRLVKSNTIKTWTELIMKFEDMPDRVMVNGEEYKLTKINVKKK